MLKKLFYAILLISSTSLFAQEEVFKPVTTVRPADTTSIIARGLERAIGAGKKELAELLSKADSNLKMIGAKALIASSKNGYQEIVELLIKAGVDVNARDANGRTALQVAKTEEIKKILKDAGAVQ